MVACGDAGLKIVDISDPKNPVLVGSISTGGLALGSSSIEIGEKIYALTVNKDAGLKIIKIIKLSIKYRNYFPPISNSKIVTGG